ncbi:helix-turn-helix transcriptional regulator [Nocardioides mangrovi]|uniref:Helix-turn-helix transcriptional regulator n=1 Tax=Nocardioides mangrovi TaxID=2874580 RepID=A0ABS7UA03_9ACTN|nr:helix-turn-helix transcriptional regulator [Nocardioides mangrovi]MBZ5737675.1 helix-turn-helix transcriptional regulator [Nocardioides mangrovi]
MDRAQLADFLRTRREALQPEDVGLPRGPRRRTGGLRREEVAALCGMSTDYYSRIEQQRSTNLSEQMLAALARGLRLSLDERDHLFRLGGHAVPDRALRTDHVDAGIMRILDRLTDTPAMVVNGLGETLLQNQPAIALVGDESGYAGLRRYVAYRWFTEPESRSIYPEEDHDFHGRAFTADLRAAYTRGGPGSPAAELVDTLLERSEEFVQVWSEHEVGVQRTKIKRIDHPEVGLLEVHCQNLYDVDQSQSLLVFTAVPGSESHEKLALLTVLGAQRVSG